ncbi:unnamed protein product [Symbiodinium natans]|uniref:Methyltransferase domain-containing protein n=1 Tax=Symbiodinium natans TaxID=878477 RepID=A0A812URE3_9DINO|nr:unnamed protein product [Symbiodinium natans]
MAEVVSNLVPDFCNYSDTADTYAELRKCLFADVLNEHCAGKDVIEVGAGTGNNVLAIARHAKSVRALEYNKAMLAHCERRCQEEGFDNVLCTHGCAQQELPKLASDPATHADVAIIVQVLHHLTVVNAKEPSQNTDRAHVLHRIREIFKALFDMIRPGGEVLINTVGHEQARDCFWFKNLLPVVLARYIERFPKVEELQDLLKDVGFVDVVVTPHTRTLYDIPLKEQFSIFKSKPMKWAKTDSFFEDASEEEILELCEKMTSWTAEEEQAYILQHTAKQQEMGVTSFISGRKPLA